MKKSTEQKTLGENKKDKLHSMLSVVKGRQGVVRTKKPRGRAQGELFRKKGVKRFRPGGAPEGSRKKAAAGKQIEGGARERRVMASFWINISGN